jgi:hypothetical protein
MLWVPILQDGIITKKGTHILFNFMGTIQNIIFRVLFFRLLLHLQMRLGSYLF